MQFVLRINLDGAAFVGADDDYGPGPEVARILRELAERIDQPGDVSILGAKVRDFNGNTCGRFAFGTGSFDLEAVML